MSELMAEMVASAVVGDAVSRTCTFLIDKHDRKSSEEDDMERLEMAHIRMEATLEASSKWPAVTNVPLLLWRKKLKRASDECSHALHLCKRRAMEEEEMEQEAKRCSFPKRIAHATRSFISSFAAHKNDTLINTSTVQRFERFADGAGEFLRLMEFSSIRRRMNYMLVDPLIGHLLGGKALQYDGSQGSEYFLTAKPIRFAERGLEARVLLRYQNHEMPEKNFVLGILLRLTESTDLTGIVARCLDSLTPHFKPVAEAAKQELTRIHTRSLYCFPFVDSTDPVYWNIHHGETHRARANPACCEGHEQEDCNRRSGKLELPGVFPEPVIKLFVQRHVSASPSSGHGDMNCFQDLGAPLLQITSVFAPHAIPEELPSGAESAAIVAVGGREEEQVMRKNVGLQELDELLLPSAIDRLRHEALQGSPAAAHEAFWRSRHGVAYLCVEKTGTEVASSRLTQWRV